MGGYEVLGADTGVALTSFQTPLATLHKFNGWADKFLVTPPNGLRDLYALVGLYQARLAGFDSVGLTATYHDYDSDRLSLNYGDEWDAAAGRQAQAIHLHAEICRLQRKGLCHRYQEILGIRWNGRSEEMTMTDKPHLIVIGNGMAGCRAVEEILARDADKYPHHDFRGRTAGQL